MRPESTRNAEPQPDKDRNRGERNEGNRRRPVQEDLILHDDDEAELDLPR